MIEGVLLHGFVYAIAQSNAFSNFASMVEGVLLRGIVLSHCTTKSSSDSIRNFAYSRFCGGWRNRLQSGEGCGARRSRRGSRTMWSTSAVERGKAFGSGRSNMWKK